MQKLFQYLGVITILAFGVSLSAGWQGTARGSNGFKVRTITTSGAADGTIYANDPAWLAANLGISHYNQVCWKRMDSVVAEFAYVANSDVDENDSLGWANVGTEKECYDWDQGVKLYFWHTFGEGAKTIKLIFIE